MARAAMPFFPGDRALRFRVAELEQENAALRVSNERLQQVASVERRRADAAEQSAARAWRIALNPPPGSRTP